VGLAVELEQDTPPLHSQLLNCQPVEGEGRLAVAEKLLGQVLDCSFVNVFPQVVMEPADVPVGNVDGVVLNMTCPAANSACPKLFAIGEPHPVTGSQPVPAEYPLDPEVISWKFDE
jgi:hypothetical protein